jgi:hypothetical protein
LPHQGELVRVSVEDRHVTELGFGHDSGAARVQALGDECLEECHKLRYAAIGLGYAESTIDPARRWCGREQGL